jgi:PhnB protein
MPIKSLNPYIVLNGDADAAIKHYEKALDAKVEGLQRFGDVEGTPADSPYKNRVIHALLRVGGGVIMLSDSMVEQPVTVETNGTTNIVLEIDTPEELSRRFDALSAGGKITMAVQDTFWGAKFGTLVDKFGIQWMLNCTLPK